MLTLPEHLSSSPVFSGVRVTRSLVLYVCFVDRCLSFCTFFFWSLCCLLFFDIRFLIAPLISSSSSYTEPVTVNHDVLCWASGCESWCVILYKLLWIICVLQVKINYMHYSLMGQIEWVSEWVVLSANSAIFQQYHGENKLIFNELMMRSAFY